MERYINVDLFKKNTNPVWYQPDDNSEYCGVYNKKDIEDMIDAQPTADVQEVKHGHWEPYKGEYIWAVCSVCGSDEIGKRPYCGNCGAKMDEVEK